ncbi:MAG: endonuclease/exonuclease/phosphatase family protein, partial [Candidatus Thiodiazotropha sp. (ex Lucinoma borealis)]|nr:endonuclease/exonuclease/phosphatase family protein [Candidatus Thiodiazotropha sp. (ex Lucinoma borealis)]
MQWNARSLISRNFNSKMPELQKYLESFGKIPEVICIQETWNNECQKLLNIPGYKPPVSFRRKRGKKGGGVAIFVKIGIDSEEIETKQISTDTEIAIVRIFGTKHHLDIANYYTPGGTHIPSETYIKIVEKMGKNAILLGDFNAKNELWDSTFTTYDDNGDEIINFLNATEYITLNSGCGTRLNITNGNTTAIDLTFATASIAHKCEWHVHGDTLGSDHFPVVTSVGVSHKHVNQGQVPRWKLDKADWDLFKYKINKMNIFFDNMTINESNHIFINTIMAACEIAIPKTKPSAKNRKVIPWWDENCTASVKKKNKAYYKYRKYRTDLILEQFRLAREECKFILESIRKDKWRAFISNLNCRMTSKKLWDTIKRFKVT